MNIFIIGTRAQLIKVAPVIRKFEDSNKPIIFILTGQHNDTMQDLIDEFEIKNQPIQLIKNKEHSSIITLLFWLPQVFLLLLQTLKEYTNGYIFVHGDTLTTLLSTLSGRLTKNKIIHLESGLTSKSLFNPFPEEIIRRIVFRYTHIAFCPSISDIENMQKYRNIKTIHTHGNTILDSIQYLKIDSETHILQDSILVSLHRFQNIYNKKRLKEITDMLVQLSEKFKINFVLHPATHKKLIKFNLLKKLENNFNIQLLPRMTYKKFLNLALSNEVVITDGGSNQEELAFFGHPTIILRETTERTDGLSENAILIEDPKIALNYILEKKYIALQMNKKMLKISPSEVILSNFKNIN